MLGNWDDFSSDWLGCGVHEHGPECLCDVKITKPTPMVRDCVNDIWMGPQICDVQGYGKPWTRAKLADYLTDLGNFQAAIRAYGMVEGGIEMSTLNDTSFAGMTNLRIAVQEFLNKMPEPSIVSALQILGVTPAKFVTAITQAKIPNAETWTIEKMEAFERDTLARTKISTMMERYGISQGNFYRIKEYMRPVFKHHKISFQEGKSMERKSARNLAKKLIAEGLENSAIIAQVEAEFGIRYSSAAISKIRVREF